MDLDIYFEFEKLIENQQLIINQQQELIKQLTIENTNLKQMLSEAEKG